MYVRYSLILISNRTHWDSLYGDYSVLCWYAPTNSTIFHNCKCYSLTKIVLCFDSKHWDNVLLNYVKCTEDKLHCVPTLQVAGLTIVMMLGAVVGVLVVDEGSVQLIVAIQQRTLSTSVLVCCRIMYTTHVQHINLFCHIPP